MDNEKKKKYWLIPLIIGLVIGTIGLAVLIYSSKINVPSMGEDGWFESKSSQNGMEALGIVLMAVGYFMIALMGTIATFAIQSTWHSARPIMQSVSTLYNSAVDKAKEYLTPEEKKKMYCEYCGTLIVDTKTNKCSSCGAVFKPKK